MWRMGACSEVCNPMLSEKRPRQWHRAWRCSLQHACAIPFRDERSSLQPRRFTAIRSLQSRLRCLASANFHRITAIPLCRCSPQAAPSYPSLLCPTGDSSPAPVGLLSPSRCARAAPRRCCCSLSRHQAAETLPVSRLVSSPPFPSALRVRQVFRPSGTGAHALAHSLAGHTDTVRSLHVMEGVGVISGSHDCTARLWTFQGDVLAGEPDCPPYRTPRLTVRLAPGGRSSRLAARLPSF